MDWQLIEISVVTVLALWVMLFAGNSLSRAAAAIMMVLNVLWILFEREKPRARATAGQDAARAPAPPAPGAKPEPEQPGKAEGRHPRIL